MNKETLPYMTDEQFGSVAFVYRSKKGCIKVVGMLEAKTFDNNPEFEHLATLDSFRWIESLLRSSQKRQKEQIKEILK
jgi:hypothetical protein